MKKYLFSLSFLAVATCAMAQSGTNSPYSMYGLGKLADRSVGASRGMNGVGLAFREHNTVNTLNPASYSAVDSLTFIFDAGLSLQNTNFKEYDTTNKTNVSKNAKNANIEYVVALFRLVKHVGMSFGILPYSNVGYSFGRTSKAIPEYSIAPATTTVTTETQTFKSGSSYYNSYGLHEIYLGAGWETPLKGLSIGANVGYIWGDINRYNTVSYSDTYVKSLARQYTFTARNYKLDLGMQYTHKIDKKYTGTIAVTFSPGHRLGANADCKVITANSSSSVNDTTMAVASNPYALPTELGIGLALAHTNTWKVGLDYNYQAWGSIDPEGYVVQSGVNKGKVIGYTDSYSNRHSIKAGGEYCKNERARDVIDRFRYRLGVGYATPYQKINGSDGPREISVSAGVGIPIINAYNNRSILNIGFSWVNRKAKNYITENALMLNVGMTFNERWFAKWKFE